jgi:hypothetical protein
MVNNAGGSPRQLFLDASESRCLKIVELNLNSIFYCTGAAVRVMIEGKRKGSIINISSIEGSRGAPGFAVYSACKGGLDNFTKSAAVEFANRNNNRGQPEGSPPLPSDHIRSHVSFSLELVLVSILPKHCRAPFALEGQDRRRRCNVWLSGGRRN